MFKRKVQSCMICVQFPSFTIGDSCVQYVLDFKYLGHVIMTTCLMMLIL